MMQHHNYSLTELDNMIPWERGVYVDLLIKHIAEGNECNRQVVTQDASRRLTYPE